MRLNYDIKRPHIERMQQLADHYGIAFFVSDAHHKEKSHAAGCCGLPDSGPLSNIHRGQYAEAIQIAKQKGIVYWSDIAPQAEGLKHIPFAQAEGYNLGSTRNRAQRKYMSMFDFMRQVWNDPRDLNSPARYFGGALVPSGVDAQGDIIYLYNRPFVDEGRRVATVAELAATIRASAEAERQDGRPQGHVAYPIYVQVTAPDPAQVNLFSLLDASRLPFTACVPLPLLAGYTDAHPTVDFVPMPVASRAAGRQFILDYARSLGGDYCWLLDDRITGFGAPPRAVFSGIEAQVEPYAHIAVAGPAPAPAPKPFAVNQGIRACLLLSLSAPLAFDEQADSLQDTDLCLQALDAGYTTLLSHAYTLRAAPVPPTPQVRRYLATRWPSYVTDGEEGIAVHWHVFNTPLTLRDLFDAVVPAGRSSDTKEKSDP
jgi:hypothetical protein